MISVLIFNTCLGCFGIFKLWMWHFKRRHLYELASQLDGPPTLPIVGNAHSFIGDCEHIFKKLTEFTESYASLWRIWLGPTLGIGISDADQIQEICSNPTTMDKGYTFRHFAGAFLGTGILSAPVSKWRVNRKIIQPTFNRRILESYVEIFASQAKIFTEQIERNLDGPEFEVSKFLSSLTIDIVCGTFASVDLGPEESIMGVKIGAQTDPNSRFADALEHANYSITKRLFTFWLHPDFIFNRTKLGKTAEKSIKYLHHFIERVIDIKQKECNSSQPAGDDNGDGEFSSAPQKNSWMDHILRMTDDNLTSQIETTLDHLLELSGDAGKLSDQDIRDEVNTIIAAGSDTSAITMSFIMLMLASHPDVQDKVYQELYEVYGDADSDERPVIAEDLRLMKYLEQVIKETLRLFPTGAFAVRQVTKDLNMGVHTLPKGAYTLIGIRSPQRNEKYWPNPLKFDPDRFLPEEVAKRHPYSFMAFSGGPRNCIGMNYAMMSMKTVIATVLRRYVLKKDHIVPIEDIRLTMQLLLKPVIPITLRIERRPRNYTASLMAQQ